MKKIYTLFLMLVALIVNAQTYVPAPVENNATQLRLPNGTITDAFVNGYYYITATELANVSQSSPILNLRLKKVPTPGDSTVKGLINLYMLNVVTQPAVFSRGTTFGTVTTGMTQVYADSFNLTPDTGFITINLSTPFQYTGGGMYIAYSYNRSGTRVNSNLLATTWAANNSLAASCFTTRSTTTITTMSTAGSGFRPATWLGFTNTDTNNASVDYVEVAGKSLRSNSTTIFNNVIKSKVTNLGVVALTNLVVTLNITGAVTATQTVTIPTLAAGASQIIGFNFNSLLDGACVANISIPNDQNNSNNSKTKNFSLNCVNYNIRNNEAPTSSVGYNTGAGTLLFKFKNTSNTSVTLKGSSFLLNNTVANTNQKLLGVALNYSGTFVATSDTFVTATANLGTEVQISFKIPLTVASGDSLFVGIAQIANTTTGFFPLATFTSGVFEAGTFAGTGLAGGAITIYSTLGSLMLGTFLDSSSICNSFTNLNTLSIDNKNNKLSINPNPSHDNTKLVFELANEQLVKIDLLDNSGRIIKNIYADKTFGINELTIDLKDLSQGMYIVRMTSDNEVKTVRLIKN